jgi:hypothetical protein
MKSLKGYFHPGKPKTVADTTQAQTAPVMAESANESTLQPKVAFDPHTSSLPVSSDGSRVVSRMVSRPVSRPASRPGSLFPTEESRDNETLLDIKCEVMVNWLYQKQLNMMWEHGYQGEGVVLKKSRGVFTACPPDLMAESGGLFDAVQKLNVRVY